MSTSWTMPFTYQPGRILDPIRAAALERAISAIPWPDDEKGQDPDQIIEVAKKFEAYLAGTDGA